MNKAAEHAVRLALGNAEDNLHRAKLQQKADPNWVSGNGQKQVDELKEVLQ
jgi:hypothetical protein